MSSAPAASAAAAAQGFIVESRTQGDRVVWDASSPAHRLLETFPTKAEAEEWASTTAELIADGHFPKLLFENDSTSAQAALKWVLDGVDPEAKHVPVEAFNREADRGRDLYATKNAVYSAVYNDDDHRGAEDLELLSANAGVRIAVEIAGDVREAYALACSESGVAMDFLLYVGTLGDDVREKVLSAVGAAARCVESSSAAWDALYVYENAVVESNELRGLTPEQEEELRGHLSAIRDGASAANAELARREKDAVAARLVAAEALSDAVHHIARSAQEKANEEVLARIGRLAAGSRAKRNQSFGEER